MFVNPNAAAAAAAAADDGDGGGDGNANEDNDGDDNANDCDDNANDDGDDDERGLLLMLHPAPPLVSVAIVVRIVLGPWSMSLQNRSNPYPCFLSCAHCPICTKYEIVTDRDKKGPNSQH